MWRGFHFSYESVYRNSVYFQTQIGIIESEADERPVLAQLMCDLIVEFVFIDLS